MRMTLMHFSVILTIGTAASERLPYQPEPITPAQVQARLQRGERLLFTDVRHPTSFRREHIPAAVSFPYARLAEGRVDLPRDRGLVLYCT